MGRIYTTYTLLFAMLMLGNLNMKAQNKKTIKAERISGAIKIDGSLDEPEWQNAPLAKDFVMYEPFNGKTPTLPTEVRFLYDNTALYVGAVLYDSAPDSINTNLAKRDNSSAVADYFGVFISPYNDGISAYDFWVLASGVQLDCKHSSGNDDYSWNAVWQSATKITDKGWVVEMKIPYSALRFPKKDIQEWGLNIIRNVRRRSEWSSWSFVDKNVNGLPNQSGLLQGIEKVSPPIRLSFTPYLSSYYEKNSITDKNTTSMRGGMDVKYGINESYTLDMMLIPDFGQVQSDDAVLNLSTVETKFDEKRNFFSEGTDLFSKGGIFYSRRIGGRPSRASDVSDQLIGHEGIELNPGNVQLLNATKISGRNKSGLGIGFLNAMGSNTYATIKDSVTGQKRNFLTQPFTNYNLVVVDQMLKNYSYLSLINTNYIRPEDGYTANVTATDIKLSNKSNTYALYVKGGMSHIQTKEDNTNGFFYNTSIQKTSGRFKFNLRQILLDNKYNPSDMGYIENNNQITNTLDLQYNRYTPNRFFLNYSTTLSFLNTELYRPYRYMNFEVNYVLSGTLKNNSYIGQYGGFNPFKKYDYFEPRVFGWKSMEPSAFYLGGYYNSDSRKRLSFNWDGWYWIASRFGRNTFNTSANINFRAGDKFNLSYSFADQEQHNGMGFADKNEAQDSIIYGQRDIKIISNTLETSYIFNNRSSLSLRLRHYLSTVSYSKFMLLKENGEMDENISYNKNNNQSYNAFTIDFIYTWQFLPGSELSLAWKNAIFSDKEWAEQRYFQNLHATIQDKQINNLSIKILYYLDYLSLKRK